MSSHGEPSNNSLHQGPYTNVWEKKNILMYSEISPIAWKLEDMPYSMQASGWFAPETSEFVVLHDESYVDKMYRGGSSFGKALNKPTLCAETALGSLPAAQIFELDGCLGEAGFDTSAWTGEPTVVCF